MMLAFKRFRSNLLKGFSLDLRSLALLRIGLAILILVDLGVRSSDLQAHYTDFGVLPRSVVIDKLLDPWHWSFHLFSGQAFFQIILFLIAGIAAVALLVGYQTPLATVLSWILLVSLHNRNPLVLNSGDVELRLLLLWSIFLPLGARYSLDRVLKPGNPYPQDCFFSASTIALTLQVCLIYWFAWAFKTDPIWRVDGTGVYYALSLDQFVTPIGRLIYQFPGLMKVSNFITLWIEGLGPFLLFIPYRNDFFRTIAVVVFILLHMGFHLGLYLGIFPFVCAIGWLAFLPGQFWDRHYLKYQIPQSSLKLYYSSGYERLVQFFKIFLILPAIETIQQPSSSKRADTLVEQPEPTVSPSALLYGMDEQGQCYAGKELDRWVYQHSPLKRYVKSLFNLINLIPRKLILRKLILRKQIWKSETFLDTPSGTTHFNRYSRVWMGFQNLFVLFLLTCVLIWNFVTLPNAPFQLPTSLRLPIFGLELHQKWDMFAPYPLTEDGWYVIPAQLQNGQQVDLFQAGKPVTWVKPQWVARTYKNQRWRKYMMNLWDRRNEPYRLYYGRYLCRNWNKHHPRTSQVQTFRIIFMLEKTLDDYKIDGIRPTEIWRHNCFG